MIIDAPWPSIDALQYNKSLINIVALPWSEEALNTFRWQKARRTPAIIVWVGRLIIASFLSYAAPSCGQMRRNVSVTNRLHWIALIDSNKGDKSGCSSAMATGSAYFNYECLVRDTCNSCSCDLNNPNGDDTWGFYTGSSTVSEVHLITNVRQPKLH